MMVMSAAPGSKISSPYRRIYDKINIQRITIDRSPENILPVSDRSGVRPGTVGPVLSWVGPTLKNARFDFLKFSRRFGFTPLKVEHISGVRKRP